MFCVPPTPAPLSQGAAPSRGGPREPELGTCYERLGARARPREGAQLAMILFQTSFLMGVPSLKQWMAVETGLFADVR